MTKVSVFGQQPTETKELKKIEFVKRVCSDATIEEPIANPCSWQNVMLYRESSGYPSFDMILAWDNYGEKAFLLGHWNDGVV